MPEFVTAREAVACIKNGDFIGVNTFLTHVNPEELLTALAERFEQTGEPNNLTMYCETGFGNWEAASGCERIITSGGAKAVVLSHYATMPGTAKMVLENKVAGYNLLLGAMSHMVREASRGNPFYITKSGVNLFVDPKYGGSKLNALATEDWVTDIEIDGERYLKYKTPKFDIAILKGTSCDRYGNITMEGDSCVLDAMSLAMATRRNGGKVIVQVSKFTEKRRPWECIVPGSFVDYIAVCPDQKPILGIEGFDPNYCGDRFMSPAEITDFVLNNGAQITDPSRVRIAQRAAMELRPGMFINVGIGIPEGVAVEAAKKNLLSSLTFTVEDGAIGGMPASGKAFGAAVGAHCIINAAQMFDFYDGGGLDICYLGALEVDAQGNVNGHINPTKLAGVGGFANITQNTKKVVFCTTFTAGGLEIENNDGTVHIIKEGRIPKFVKNVCAISFSSENAHSIDQEVLYVTERCVFKLGAEGLVITEVYDGIDLQRDILDKLPFEVKVELEK
jgi:propionate CoA-transferase